MRRYWSRGLWQRIWLVFCSVMFVLISAMFGIAYWYQQQHKNEPLVIGTTFIAPYAESLGVDARETLQASIQELGIKQYRLVSYWNEHEKEQGKYDFSQLDWQFDMIEASGGTVSLAIGLRQPRWPECHMPSWAKNKDLEVWYPQLRNYISAVVSHYKDRPSLKSYQLENEFFLSVFGDCPDHSRWRLVEEYNLVKSLDNKTPIIVSRSNNATPSWPVGEPRADVVAASIYKRVWDKTFTKRYFEYPLPPWYYSFLAGATQITTGKNTIIHELQTEPWLPNGYDLRTAPISEMYKSMNPDMFIKRLDYAVDTGIKSIDMWGMEWWYAMKVVRQDDGMWQAAKHYLKTR